MAKQGHPLRMDPRKPARDHPLIPPLFAMVDVELVGSKTQGVKIEEKHGKTSGKTVKPLKIESFNQTGKHLTPIPYLPLLLLDFMIQF